MSRNPKNPNLMYMKYVYQDTVFNYSTPKENQTICKIIKVLGNSTFMVSLYYVLTYRKELE